MLLTATQLDGEVTVRPAGPGEWRAGRLLLPEAIHHGSNADLVVATVGEPPRVVGAAAVSVRLRWSPVPGPRVAVHVIGPMRRRGVARRLLSHVETAARRISAAAVYAWQPVEPGADAAQVWAGLGLDQCAVLQETRIDAARLEAYLTPFWEQMSARGWVPAEARLVPLGALGPVEIEQVAAMHVAHLGGSRDYLLPRLRGQVLDRFHPNLSLALMMSERVMGLTLGRLLPGSTYFVDANVLDPSLRGGLSTGWANVWLKLESARRCRENGTRTYQFHTHDQHSDTRKLARKVGGVTAELVHPYRRFA